MQTAAFTGWQALWKISRVYCEEMNIAYPTIVYGSVQKLLSNLQAEFEVISVQDDDVHIHMYHDVPLEDLWPTKQQENSVLDVEGTANCIDSLRYVHCTVQEHRITGLLIMYELQYADSSTKISGFPGTMTMTTTWTGPRIIWNHVLTSSMILRKK